MKQKRELWVRILSVVAPLIMLCTLTIAWFVNSVAPQVTQMSFASADAGPGAVMHKATDVLRADLLPNIISTVTWGPELSNTKAEGQDDSSITIENMLPNQCSYYLLVSNHTFSVNLTKLKLWNGDGAEVTNPADVPLAQCLAFYLIPLEKTTPAGGSEPTEKTTVSFPPLPEHRTPSTRLDAAHLAGLSNLSQPVPLPVTGGAADTYYDAYVLAVYYDPVYDQGVAGTPKDTATMPGKVSFALSFPSQGSGDANG